MNEKHVILTVEHHPVIMQMNSDVNSLLLAVLKKSVSESSLSEEGESDVEEDVKNGSGNGDDSNTVDLESFTVVPDSKVMQQPSAVPEVSHSYICIN